MARVAVEAVPHFELAEAAPLEEAQRGIGLEVFDEEAGGDGPPGALDGGVEQGVSDAASPVLGGDENLADGGVGGSPTAATIQFSGSLARLRRWSRISCST